MIELKNISKRFNDGSEDVEVLKNTNLEISSTKFTAIVGPSGSGKSTLLTIIGALQSPSEGEVIINGTNINKLSDKEKTKLRFDDIGFVLQGSNLIPYLSILEQYELKLKKAKTKIDKERINEVLKNLSIYKVRNKYPDEVSGGERQRAAIGLALLLKPKLILADEPTASLDTDKAIQVVETLQKISRSENTSVIMVTHDTRLLDYCDHIIEIVDGNVSVKS